MFFGHSCSSNLFHLFQSRSYVRRFIRHFPKIQEMLQYGSECAVCGESFLNTWLECVHFVDAKKVHQNNNFIVFKSLEYQMQLNVGLTAQPFLQNITKYAVETMLCVHTCLLVLMPSHLYLSFKMVEGTDTIH